MKLSVIFVLIFVSCVKPQLKNKPLPKLTPLIGEYRAEFKNMYNCNPTKENKINTNYYLNKMSDGSMEVKGNISLSIPFDDNLSVGANAATRGADGNWKNNAYIFHAERGYTTTKNFFSNIDTSGLGFNLKSPIPVGVHIATGFNASDLENINYIPKKFAYGSYKIRVFLTDKKNQHFGCLETIVQLKPPSKIL
ncbi:uncharacterized protein LOC111033738 [Myzus persicae]|uniref:uncharacterized protein LOC111033738 n=1 Tax=Myzus persicae TaxID=13164 RepID=UPI000B939D0C|nr:uncharacterized protein LOC111033738 [Myzus persicae]